MKNEANHHKIQNQQQQEEKSRVVVLRQASLVFGFIFKHSNHINLCPLRCRSRMCCCFVELCVCVLCSTKYGTISRISEQTHDKWTRHEGETQFVVLLWKNRCILCAHSSSPKRTIYRKQKKNLFFVRQIGRSHTRLSNRFFFSFLIRVRWKLANSFAKETAIWSRI